MASLFETLKKFSENLEKGILANNPQWSDEVFSSRQSNSISSNGNSVTINGITITGGGNITMKNGRVWVDGKEVSQEDLKKGAVKSEGGFMTINVEGVAGSLTVDNAEIVTVGFVKGNVESRNGAINCGDVNGSVEARNGAVTCGNVGGNASSRNGDVKYTINQHPQRNSVPKVYKDYIKNEVNKGSPIVVFKNGEFVRKLNRGELLDWDNHFYSVSGQTEDTSKNTTEFCEIKE